MGMVPCISHPGPPVVRWELEPGEAQEARGPVCSACNVHETETRPHSERWGYPGTPAPVFIQRIKEQRGGRGGRKICKDAFNMAQEGKTKEIQAEECLQLEHQLHTRSHCGYFQCIT